MKRKVRWGWTDDGGSFVLLFLVVVHHDLTYLFLVYCLILFILIRIVAESTVTARIRKIK